MTCAFSVSSATRAYSRRLWCGAARLEVLGVGARIFKNHEIRHDHVGSIDVIAKLLSSSKLTVPSTCNAR